MPHIPLHEEMRLIKINNECLFLNNCIFPVTSQRKMFPMAANVMDT